MSGSLVCRLGLRLGKADADAKPGAAAIDSSSSRVGDMLPFRRRLTVDRDMPVAVEMRS